MLELGCVPPGSAHVSLHVADGKHEQLTTPREIEQTDVMSKFKRVFINHRVMSWRKIWSDAKSSCQIPFLYLDLLSQLYVACLGQGTHVEPCPTLVSKLSQRPAFSFIQCFESCTLCISILACILSACTVEPHYHAGKDLHAHASFYIFRTWAGYLGVCEWMNWVTLIMMLSLGSSASCLGWVSGHQDIRLVKVSSISCVFVSSLPSLPHQVIHFSPTSHMKFEFGLCCAWFILCFFTTKKKNFSFQSKMSFKIMFPVFIAYFYSLLTKSVLKDFLSLWSRPSGSSSLEKRGSWLRRPCVKLQCWPLLLTK